MMFHKPKDGESLRLIPLYFGGKYLLCHKLFTTYIGNRFIYDTSDKNYLYEIFKRCQSSAKSSGKMSFSVAPRSIYSVLVGKKGGDEIKLISIGNSLSKVILSFGMQAIDVNNNAHLIVSIVDKHGFPDYSGSKFIDKTWSKPIGDNMSCISSKEEWGDWISKNQPDVKEGLDKMSLYRNIDLIKKVVGDDNILANVIKDMRDNKLEQILK